MRKTAINKINNAKCQLKSRSEAGFPMKGFRTSHLYSSRHWVEMLNCLLDLESKNRQEWIMLEMNSKWNNTSVSNWNRIRAREREQSQTQEICFEVWVSNSTSPPLLCEGFHYPLKIFSQKSLHKGITRSRQDRSTQF